MTPPPQFITQFAVLHSTVTQNADRERSWYFEVKDSRGPGTSKGYVHYGTFGFESNFVDTNTKKHNYRRKVTDIEEIPLFFEFWYPTKSTHIFAVFQSFQGRSCIQLVMSEMQESFEKANPGFVIVFKKLLPNDLSAACITAPR